jgi:hypothetical protein
VPKVFEFSITDHTTGSISRVAGNIPDDEWEVLLGFSEGAASLAGTEFVQRGMPVHYQIDGDGQLSATAERPLPEPSVVREFLHAMRPFILSKEPWSYQRVAGILGRRIDHPLWRGLIERDRKSFRADMSQAQFVVRAGGLVLNSEAALDLWLNGYEYHRDPEKRKRLEATQSDVKWELTEALFLDTLAAKAEAVFDMTKLVEFVRNGRATASGQS